MELNKAKENVKKDNVKPKEGRERLQMDSMKLNEAQGGQDQATGRGLDRPAAAARRECTAVLRLNLPALPECA